MNNLSIRGLDDEALAKLKKLATTEEASVNALVLRFIEQGLGHKRAKVTPQRHTDLDELAGTWTRQEGKEFERLTAPFGKVDADLWK
jgi:plasmid stability protein